MSHEFHTVLQPHPIVNCIAEIFTCFTLRHTYDHILHLFLKIILAFSYLSSFTVCLDYLLLFQPAPTFCFHKTKHVHTLAEKFFLSPCLVFQGLVVQQEKPQRNIMATCAEILIRRKWGGTTSLLFSINLHRWTLAACHILVWHTDGVCLWHRETCSRGGEGERWGGRREEEKKRTGVEGASTLHLCA